MILNIIVAVVALVLGGLAGYFVFRYVITGKYKEMICAAEKEADVLKEKKLLEVKEKFLNEKSELEKEVRSRNQKIQQSENRLKQREISLNQRQEELGRRKQDLDQQQQYDLSKQCKLGGRSDGDQPGYAHSRHGRKERVQKCDGLLVADGQPQQKASQKYHT